VALLLRSAEIHPVFVRFVDRSNSISPPPPLNVSATGELLLLQLLKRISPLTTLIFDRTLVR